jgi:hypothetical protein
MVAPVRISTLLEAYAKTHDKAVPLSIREMEFGYYVGTRAPENKAVRMVPAVKLRTDGGVVYISAESADSVVLQNL